MIWMNICESGSMGEHVGMEKITEKKKAFVSAIVYIHSCEKKSLEDFCTRILKHIRDSFENMEVIFVVDGYEDVGESQIREIVGGLSLSDRASIVQFPYFQGIEAANGAGDDLSIGDFVFEFDDVMADYGTELIDRAFDTVKEGYDIVSVGDDSMRFSSRLFYLLINHGKKEKIHHETFRIVSRRAINRIKILNKTVPYRKMLYATCGLPEKFLTYRSNQKVRSRQSRFQKSYRLDSGFKFMIIFTRMIEKITMFLSLLFLLAAVGTGAWALYDHFFGNAVAGGWVSLMAVISFGFFGLFLLIMVILKYLSLLIDANYKKADYVVEKVEKI